MESFLPQVDSVQLKAQLNRIMADVGTVASDSAISAKGTEEAGRCISEFSSFFVSCAERHGSTPHAVLGQHVVNNVFVFVLERIVKPQLMAYCRFAEKHAANALEASSAAGGSGSGVGRHNRLLQQQQQSSIAVSTGRRDAWEARRRRLRGDIVRPFIELFQSLHTFLTAEGEPLTAHQLQQQQQQQPSNSATNSARAAWESSLEGARGGSDNVRRGDYRRATTDTVSLVGATQTYPPSTTAAAAGGAGAFDDDDDRDGGVALPEMSPSLSQAPLQWKGASPLNMLCNHILEVLESQWLVSVVGADYAALLLEVLRWSGYARLVTPVYLVRLSGCLLTLLERVPLHPNGANMSIADGEEESGIGADGTTMVAPNLLLQEVGDGRVWVAAPTADDACCYAQVLVCLYGLPQVSSAYPPSATTTAAAARKGDTLSYNAYTTNLRTAPRQHHSESDALAVVRRLMELVMLRHQSPTPDLRLEAYCVAALRQLCCSVHHDHPAVASASVGVVKLLCDFFFLPHHTPRHDVWRLEVMQFIAAVLAYALADRVGVELRRDIHPSNCTEADRSPGMATDNVAAATADATPVLPSHRELLVLLHQTVYPTMCRIFTQQRHEYSFVSRRELFSFPCSPLQEVFDFGGVVLYLCSATHAAYDADVSSDLALTTAAAATTGELHDDDDGGKSGVLQQRKRRREPLGLNNPCDDVSGAKETTTTAAPAGSSRKETSEAQQQRRPHPVQPLCAALCDEFFQRAPPPQTTTATSATPPSVSRATCRRLGDAPLVLRICTAGIRTNSAAVHDVVSDRSLFLLHLLAQPCATLRCPHSVTDTLVEDVLLPLSGAFEVRMGPLLLATINAVIPHCSAATQFSTFALLAQRSFPRRLGYTLMRGAVAAAAASSPSAPSPNATSAREDLLNPSEPMYQVLVTLLEQRLVHRHGSCQTSLPNAQSSSRRFGLPSSPISTVTDLIPSLDDVGVVWETHVHTLARRILSQLQTYEHAAACVREAVAAAQEAGAMGFMTHSSTTGEPSLTPLRTFVPALSSSFAALLTRFITLVQCTRLWQLALPTRNRNSDGSSSSRDDEHLSTMGGGGGGGGGGVGGSSMSGGYVGLEFVLFTAAHGVSFYERVPVLRRPAMDGRHGADGGAEGSHACGDTSRQAARHTGADIFTAGVNAATPTLASLLSSLSSSASAPAFIDAFSPADFLAWLTEAETYACSVLWACRAQQQLARCAQIPSYHITSDPLDASFTLLDWQGSNPGTAAARAALCGRVRGGVVSYLDSVCAGLNGLAVNAAANVPALLRDATEGHWMLRVPVRSTRRRSTQQRGPTAAEKEGGMQETGGVAAGSINDATRLFLPLSFQEALAQSLQGAVTWLMRRALLLERVSADTAAGAALAFTARASGKGVNTGVAAPALLSGWEAVSAPEQASAALLLAVQCTQLLHLLLRWYRAGLWYPPHAHTAITVAAEAAADMMQTRNDEQACEGDREGEAEAEGAQQVRDEKRAVRSGASANVAADAEARADADILASSPRLFDSPTSMIARLSVRGGGRVYYAVLWLCHHLTDYLEQAGLDVLATLPLWVALRALYCDVGTVLLDPVIACGVDPRQTTLQLTAAVARCGCRGGVLPLSQWQPSNPNSREVTRTVVMALHLSLDVQRLVLRAGRRTGINAYAATPLMNVGELRRIVLALLERQSLADLHTTSPATRAAAGELEDALLPSQHPLIAQKFPFLPPLLPVLPALLRLLLFLSVTPHDATADERSAVVVDCRVVVRLLQIVFARYRYQLGPALCSELMGGPLMDLEHLLCCSRADPPTTSSSSSSGSSHKAGMPSAASAHLPRKAQQRSDTVEAAASLLYTQSGRLLELWTAQLTDVHRVDMPVCTPQWQCALLQAAFAVLVRCEPAVAEVLGRFSFEFLSEATPYVVRRNAALHVGVLFRTFSARRAQVLHTLLTKAREGMLSPTPLLCSTSLLALSEAVRAAPELRVDVVYTLLECWATRGFARRGLIVECLARLTTWMRDEAAQIAGFLSLDALPSSPALPPLLRQLPPSTHLCRMHVRSLLFSWLCEYRHPLIALPFVCFGYAALEDFVVDQLSVLLPLALLLLAEADDDADSVVPCEVRPHRSEQNVRHSPSIPNAAPPVCATASGAPGSVFHQILQIYRDSASSSSSHEELRGARRRGPSTITAVTTSAAAESSGSASDTKGNTNDTGEEAGEEVRQLAPLCLVLQHISAVVAQLLVIAAHAPVPLFGDAVLDEEVTPSSSTTTADWFRRSRHRGGVGRAGVNKGQPGTDAAADQHWCEAAQKCLYWLERLLNTCEEVALVQAGSYVWCGRQLPAGECVVADVAPAAGAALLQPAVAAHSSDVLLFYLQRLAVWPAPRAVFDVVLAAHVDAVMTDVVALHRTTAEPSCLVYGTPEQLRRALTWVAGKVIAVPLSTGAPPSAPFDASSPTWPVEGSTVSVAVEESGAAAHESVSTAGSLDAAAWQARCLHLLVPPRFPQGTVEDSVADDDGRQEPIDPACSPDVLSSFFILGHGTFLQSLLHVVYSSCIAPTSLECAFRGPQQLSLLTSIVTQWCSSSVLAQPQPLHIALTYLLHWLRRGGSAEVLREVCNALLHVWPVAVSGSVLRTRTDAEEGRITQRGKQGRRGRVGTTPCVGGCGLWACAVQLARAMEPHIAVSPVVASTWRALCRSDPSLLRCAWLEQAAAFRGQTNMPETSVGATARGGGGADRPPDSSQVVVNVDDEEALTGGQTGSRHRNGSEQSDDNDDAAAAAALPPKVCAWSWSTYQLHRRSCLAPLQPTDTQRRMSTLVSLLHHICGRDEQGDLTSAYDGTTGEPGPTSRDVNLSVVGRTNGDTFSWWAAAPSAAAPPPATLLQDVAAGVDCTRHLIVRCLEVAAVWSRERARELQTTKEAPSEATATTTPAMPMLPVEQLAVAVQDAVLSGVAQLYRWSTGNSIYESSTWSWNADADTAGAPAAAAAASVVGMDTESSEEQTLACFQLLRSLSLCVLHTGATELLTRVVSAVAQVGSGESREGVYHDIGDMSMRFWVTAGGGGEGEPAEELSDSASAEQLVATFLSNAYIEQLKALEVLTNSADARLSALATHTLRIWALCLAVSEHSATSSNVLSSFDSAVMVVMCAACSSSSHRSATETRETPSDVCATYAPQLLRRVLWAVRSARSETRPAADSMKYTTGVGIRGAACTMEPPPPPPPSFSAVHVTHTSVWQPLHSTSALPDESSFLCRFVAALAHTYGVLKRSTMWTSLLPLLCAQDEQQDGCADSAPGMANGVDRKSAPQRRPQLWDSSGLASTSARLLAPLLLHIMCLRESDGQRATRREWSELLDQHVIQQAHRCPRTVKLFLRALYSCHVVLLRHTRQRGLRGSAAAATAAATTAGLNGSFTWPAAFGAVPTLQDMQECYWLSDIPARHLARAAVLVQEPQLALLFAQLSGESLFGPRTGSAALSGEMETTRSAVMLREGTVGGPAASAVSSVPYSALFPYAQSGDYTTTPAAVGTTVGKSAHEMSARSGVRARERQDTMRLKTREFMYHIFAVYAAVQQLTDVDDVSGVSAMVRCMDGPARDGGDATKSQATQSDIVCWTRDAPLSAAGRTPGDTVSGTVIRRAASPRASAVVVGNVDVMDDSGVWVNELRDCEDDELACLRRVKGASRPPSDSDPWRAALHRAAQLLQQDLPSTAMDVLLSVSNRCNADLSSGPFTDVTAPRGVEEAQVTGDPSRTNLFHMDVTSGFHCRGAPWTAGHEACLRSLLSEAAWRCAQWTKSPGVAGEHHGNGSYTSMAVPPAVLARLASPRSLTSSSSSFLMPPAGEVVHGGFYEHLLNAFLALSSGASQPCLSHLRAAEASLRGRLSATSVVSAVVAAEALSEVRQCVHALLATKTKAPASPLPSVAAPGVTVTLPNWMTWAGPNDGHARSRVDDFVRGIGPASWRLLDSVRYALRQLYGSSDGVYYFMLDATARALAFNHPVQAHRWLSDWENQGRGVSAAVENSDISSALLEKRRVDVTLRKAQVAYALGRWQAALALLQPTPVSSSASSFITAAPTTSAFTKGGGNFNLPQEHRVVQQLMMWHEELRLVPASQLVRDPFLSRAAASDNTGACSFLLARLCHTLASDIADRLTSHEHRQLEESVEESKRQRRDLEAQLHAATTAATANRAESGTSSTRAVGLPPDAAAASVLSDEQLRLMRRRIRELAGDIKRLEEEWEAERSNYGLYRRSALNAYSRFLQLHQLGVAPRPRPEKRNREPPGVTCVPYDGAENTLHAVFGFVELWLNVAAMEQGGGEVLNKVLDKAVERIPTAVFLPLASQLTAQLSSPQDAERLSFLVGRIAHDYPLQVVWPLLALRHGHTFAKSREVNTMHAVDEAKIKAAQELLADLAASVSTASPSAEKGGSRSGTGGGDYGVVKTARTASSPSLPSSASSSAPVSASVAQQVQQAQLLSSAYLELAFDRSVSAAQTDRRYPIKSDFSLMTEAHHLSIPPPTALALSTDATTTSLVPRVWRYRPYFTTPGGVNVPKVLLCELSDGQVVRQLLKAGDDLRQDALIEQVFTTANLLFHRRDTTRPLRVRTFTIVPLAPTAGILQWVEHTTPLGEYVTGRVSGKAEHPGAHERYFPGEPTTRECRMQLQNAPQRNKAEVLLKLYEVFTPALHYFFFEYFSSPQAFVERQQTFTRSVAASSVVGYLVGLGDRHVNNILLHQHTAEVVHIDLGIAFDQNKLLPVPELVPFRMTRNIIDGLGVRGTEGSLRPCAEAALGLLREKRELLRTLLSSIMHDPLARWAIGGPQQNVSDTDNSEMVQRQQLLQASSKQVAPMRARASNADAARTLARIDAKLRGYDSGDVLSVSTHIRKLLAEAQRVEHLAVMFPGWSQWV